MSAVLLTLGFLAAGAAAWLPQTGTGGALPHGEAVAAPEQAPVLPASRLFAPAKKIPFEHVTSGQPPPLRTSPVTSPGERKRVVCGLTVYEADPAVDPKFIRRIPTGDYRIRRIAPPACGG
jgi:hypothetical protein